MVIFNKIFDLKVFFLFAVLFLTAVFYLNPFYAESAAILTILAVSFGFFKKHLTGQRIVDFAIGLTLSQIVFYVLINVRNLTVLSPLNLFWELVYNLILGLIIFLVYVQYENFKMFRQRRNKGVS